MNVVSLGFFCSIAMDIGELGLRKNSFPFDWVISDIEMVVFAIKNKFDKFMLYENLFQLKSDKKIYYDSFYKIYFYHDFNKYKPLKQQYNKVYNKYKRRINRFLTIIKQPTIFIRYINPEKSINGKYTELAYLENHYEEINDLIKSFNDKNEIIFVGDDNCISSKITIFNVPIDKDDTVCRRPLYSNQKLYNRLISVFDDDKVKNLKIYRRKQIQKKIIKPFKKINSLFKRIFLNEYIHDKIINK